VTVAREAVFVSARPGAPAIVTLTLDWFDVVVDPSGFVAVAVAELFTTPLSISAWVTAYGAVQVVLAAGASVVTAQVTDSCGPAGAARVSAMARSEAVTLPLLVTAMPNGPLQQPEVGNVAKVVSVNPSAMPVGVNVRVALAGPATEPQASNAAPTRAHVIREIILLPFLLSLSVSSRP